MAAAVASETALETALRMSETTGASSDEVGAASVAVRLSTADARLSTIEGSTAASVGKVALPPREKVALMPVGAASDERHVDATIGTVSTVYVVMMTSLVMKENSVGLGHASVTGAVGPVGMVELPVGNGGGVVVAFEEVVTPVDSGTEGENDPVRGWSLFVKGVVEFWNGSDSVEFRDTGGIVADGGGTVVEFNEALGVSI